MGTLTYIVPITILALAIWDYETWSWVIWLALLTLALRLDDVHSDQRL